MEPGEVEALLGPPEWREPSQEAWPRDYEGWLYGLLDHQVGVLGIKFQKGHLLEACLFLDEKGRPLLRYPVLEPQCGRCFEDPWDYNTRELYQFPPWQAWNEGVRRLEQAFQEGYPALVKLLDEEDRLIRRRVIQILEHCYPSEETVALLTDRWQISYRAIEALIRLQGHQCVPVLLEVLLQRSEFPGELEELVVDTLGDFQDPRAVPVLLEILQDERTSIVALWAASARALGKIGGLEAVPALEGLLQRAESLRQKSERMRKVDWYSHYHNSNAATILEREAHLAIQRINGKSERPSEEEIAPSP